jgi:cytochrome P450
VTSRHPPVEDWATDFDHTDPAWVADPYPIWADLRQRCPVAHTGRYGGTWLPVTHELVSEVAYDTEHFTSRSVVVSEDRPGPDDLPAPIGLSPPITSDPPFHALARGMLLPAFGPRAIAAVEPFTRDLCRELLAQTDGQPTFDAATEYARHIPVQVIVRFLGFPAEDADSFRQFIRLVLEDVDTSAGDEEREAMFAELDAYMDAQIDDHIARPRDDLTSFLIDAEIGGDKLSREHIRGTMILLMIAGIDTTWSAIGASLWHLAQHPGDRRWLLLPFPAANRDPAFFEDPDVVRLDRTQNRHAAFGLGRHRCLGSHLARMELRVALEEWLARYPDFELADPAAVTWSGGQVRGPRALPVRIG